ncbi:MAG: bifunctional diaminohydroxyphosphoribosylaminopyrimidine deaminase/5-amino-6-(5-phosphoribosylamino)uracil reductase RibD [Verrucomicrobiaceae bacterium]
MRYDDEHWMTLALAQAARGIGLTSPNPPVGAVLVKSGRLIGEGYHRKAGGPHAEIEALRKAKKNGHTTRGASAFITLEPCSTHGRTPACTTALIESGITSVTYGAKDPNPDHSGRADKLLRSAGIDVKCGVLAEECNRLIRPFAKWITKGVPYLIAKAGQSLDGRLTRPPGEPQLITSEAARDHAMHLRAQCDAILIGAETLRTDNPRLTLRGEKIPKGKKQPWRVIVTRSGKLPKKAHVFTDKFKDRTLVLRGDLGFTDILNELARRQLTAVLLEGGGNLMGQAFSARAVDEVCWYIAPRICAGGVMSVGRTEFPSNWHSVELAKVWHETIRDNICVRGYPVWK